jgi:hypothetical protein
LRCGRAFSTANIVLERTPFDVVKVFGAGSKQANDPNQFKPMLENAEFNGQTIDTDLARRIIRDGRALLDRAEDCAEHLNKCAE